MTALKVYDQKKGKEVTIGTIKGNNLVKKVSNRHYMIKYNGYGIDRKLLKIIFMNNPEIENIIIKTKTTEYTSEIADWFNKGIKDDFGHGEQQFLAVKDMKIIK